MAYVVEDAAEGRAHNWVFTQFKLDNDPTEPLSNFKHTVYACWQLEQCPTTGRDHYQGAVVFKERLRRNQVAELLPGARCAVMKGTPYEAVMYCQKSETAQSPYFEVGNFSDISQIQGKRNDLDALHSALKEGTVTTVQEYAETYFRLWARYPNLVSNYIATTAVGTYTVPLLYVFLGPAGVGKSTFARYAAYLSSQQETKDKRVFEYAVGRGGGSQWWDGYGGERTLIINDFGGSQIPLGDFKRMFDASAFHVQVRGSNVLFSSKKIFLSSNYDPGHWYSVRGDHLAAVCRRITHIYYIPKMGTYAKFDSNASYESHRDQGFEFAEWKTYEIPEDFLPKKEEDFVIF